MKNLFVVEVASNHQCSLRVPACVPSSMTSGSHANREASACVRSPTRSAPRPSMCEQTSTSSGRPETRGMKERERGEMDERERERVMEREREIERKRGRFKEGTKR
jgi:hypothetical protein